MLPAYYTSASCSTGHSRHIYMPTLDNAILHMYRYEFSLLDVWLINRDIEY